MEDDTLAEWLWWRFGDPSPHWSKLNDDERAYWLHEADAVRRAVLRGGFRTVTRYAGT